MKNTRFLGTALVILGMAAGTSGCFATRMVRTDTVTSYDLVREEQLANVQDASASIATAPTAPAVSAPEGTLVVEALAVPPPPSSARPVRLPDEVAAAVTPSAPAPAWDPLPSYVGEFQGAGWAHRSIFSGGVGPQGSTSFRRWAAFPGRSAMSIPYGYAPSVSSSGIPLGTYGGSASGHFSSPPSFSGSVSSHFSGGYPGRGY